MLRIEARNVNDAFEQGVKLLEACGAPTPGRGGPTLEAPSAVATVYQRPVERVLFHPARDANPFLHFFEALWMLAGRVDLKFMEHLQPRFKDYSDNGVVLQGAYGWRWQHHFGFNQLERIVDVLKADHGTRRAVLTMWHPNDLNRISSSDIPCNTQVYFKIRNGVLRMTVCNRSNDIVWGAYGANMVHMSMLMEYVAMKVGVGIGTYTQISDSFHAYTDGPSGDVWNRVRANPMPVVDLYEARVVTAHRCDMHLPAWDTDLALFFDMFDTQGKFFADDFETPWFRNTVFPMWLASEFRNMKEAAYIEADDWRLACVNWLSRREK